MSYVVDMPYYDYIKNTVHFECLYELQMFELAGYCVHPNMPFDTTSMYNKEIMLSIHTYLINHPITTKIEVSYYIRNSLEYIKFYDLHHSNDTSMYISKQKITTTIIYFNKKCGEKIAYSYN